jgi:hypothetical protein
MALANPTLNEYFRAAHCLVHEALAHWPRPLISITASYLCHKDVAELVRQIGTGLAGHLEWPREITDATRISFDVVSGGLTVYGKSRAVGIFNYLRKEEIVELAAVWPDVFGSSGIFCIPGMHVNAHLIRSIKWKIATCPIHHVTAGCCQLWNYAKIVVSSNSHCVRAGIRQIAPYGDIYIEMAHGEMLAYPFKLQYAGDGDYDWDEREDSTSPSPYKWPPCSSVTNECYECELHYEGPHRRTFGVEWAEPSALVPRLLSMRDCLLSKVAGDIHRLGIDAQRIGILRSGRGQRTVFFECVGGIVARFYDEAEHHSRALWKFPSPYKWQPCNGDLLCKCRQHYNGRSRQTYGVWWIACN